jgi:peptide/nickel transport system permease protein
MRYWLGTDGAGRDLVSAIFYGIRISVGVGVISAVVALVLGAAIGLIAAYCGGVVDAVIMRIVDLQLSLPAILVALILLAVLGQGVDKTLMALVIVQWAYFARTVRASAQVERRKDYVEAALGQGLPAWRVMFRHILPNCMAPLVVTATLQIAHAITLEATMSFLGIGLPRTQPSLGMLIANGFEYMLSNKYWISIFPGVALVLLIGTINLVGDRLRRVLNPRNEG